MEQFICKTSSNYLISVMCMSYVVMCSRFQQLAKGANNMSPPQQPCNPLCSLQIPMQEMCLLLRKEVYTLAFLYDESMLFYLGRDILFFLFIYLTTVMIIEPSEILKYTQRVPRSRSRRPSQHRQVLINILFHPFL